MKISVQASVLLLVLGATSLLVGAVPLDDKGGTNVTYDITTSAELYNGAQRGNNIALRIMNDIKLEQQIFLASRTPQIFGEGTVTMDCNGLTTAFVVNVQAEITITRLTIAGCSSAAVTVQGQGAMLHLNNIIFRNHKSTQPGAALLIKEGAKVTATGILFKSITALESADASIIYITSEGSLQMTDTQFEGIATDGSLISTNTGAFIGNKITVGDTNRLGGAAFKFIGCGGQPNQLTNSVFSATPLKSAASSVISATASRPTEPPTTIFTDASPQLFTPYTSSTLPGSCTLDVSGTVFSNNQFINALIQTNGFGLTAKNTKMLQNTAVPSPTPVAGAVPDLIHMTSGWVSMNSVEISGNKVGGVALSVATPTGPVILNEVTFKANEVGQLLNIEGTSTITDKAAYNRAITNLPDRYWPNRDFQPTKDDLAAVLKTIKRFETDRDSSRRSMPVLLRRGSIEGNTASRNLVSVGTEGPDAASSVGVVMLVLDTKIQDNLAVGGSVLTAVASNVSIQESTVSGNSASENLIKMKGRGVMKLVFSTFEANKLVAGPPGASLIDISGVRASTIYRSEFTGNDAPSKIISVTDSSVVVSDITLNNNTAADFILQATNTDITIDGVTAARNVAKAVVFLDHTPLQIKDAQFVDNTAAGLLSRLNEPLYTGDIAQIANSTFQNNIIDASVQGVASILAAQRPIKLKVSNAKFIGNQIKAGVTNATGGLFLGGSATDSMAYVESSVFQLNTGAYGGALWTTQPTFINKTEFTDNTAILSGGAIYSEGSRLNVSSGTTISKNRAGSGGGLACRNCHVLGLGNTTFSDNIANETLIPTFPDTRTAPSVPCVAGGGGGICVETTESRESSETTITGTSFIRNIAKFGGAVYLENGCDKAEGVCFVQLDRLGVEDNAAGKGGGDDLYATSYIGINVCCAVKATGLSKCTQADELEALEVTCADDGSVAAKDGNGTRVATIPARIVVSSIWANKSVASGSTMLNATVTLVDNQGRPVLAVPKEMRVDIDSGRPDMVVIGNRSVAFGSSASMNITNFQVLPSNSPSNQQYELVFAAAGVKYASRIISGSFFVTIPQCSIGQYELMFRCLECGDYNGQYSLDPRIRCEPCPTGANCKGGFVVPKSGFFMPNPLVPQLQECPLEGACRRSDQTMRGLTDFVWNVSRESGKVGGFESIRSGIVSVEDRFLGLQCSKGYQGMFCGVCSKDYGRWNTRCVNCASPSLNHWYLALVILFLVFIMSITIASHLRAALYKRAPPPPPVVRADSGESGAQPVENRRKVYDLEQILAEQARRKIDQRLDIDQLTRQQEEEEAQKAMEAAQIDAERSSLHFSMLTALAKIMISYVQVVGMARGLDLNLPRPLRRFLSNYDYTSSLSWLSIECSLKGSPKAKAIKRTIITISLPVIIMAFFTLYWVTKYLKRRSKANRNATPPGMLQVAQPTRSRPTSPKSFFANRMITTALQVAFYTYPLVTSTLFRIFDCTKLRNCSSEIECDYHKLNQGYWKEGWFWTQSYDTECFSGSHLKLIVGGTVGIAVFSIGVPLLFAFSIWLRRSKLEDPRTLLRFGFLYWEYRTQCHWWEAIITARKLALLMTTIFLRYTGRYAPSIQIYTSLMVLMVAVLLQEMFRPFEDELLNRMERLSLFTSATTLILMAYYLVGPISSQVRLALAGIIMMINLAALLQFIILILWELWLWLLEKLQIQPPESFRFSDMLEVSRKLRGRWKDVRAVVVDEWLMPSLVKTLHSRQSQNGRRRLPTNIPTQEDAS